MQKILLPDSILRRPQVEQLVGLSRSTIYLRVAKGDFPAPVKLGARAVGWQLKSIQDWLADLPSARMALA